MKEEQPEFLSVVGHPTVRLTVEQAAWVLGRQAHDVPILVASRLLRPLGKPPANGIKCLATADVLELVKERSWLTKVTNAINQHWHRQNARKKSRRVNGSHGGDSSPIDLFGAVAAR